MIPRAVESFAMALAFVAMTASPVLSFGLGKGLAMTRRATTNKNAMTMKLAENKFGKPTIRQDTVPQWYILNVATGKELVAKKLLDLKVECASCFTPAAKLESEPRSLTRFNPRCCNADRTRLRS